MLEHYARTLHSANGTGIRVLGCSYCVVSFMGLQTEFPIIICNLATGTDAIIGNDVLGSVLPHTLDIKNGLLFTKGGASLQLHRRDSALSGRVFYGGPLLNTIFRGCTTLLCPDYRWSYDAIKWSVRGTNAIRRKYRSWAELWWTHRNGRFRFSCQISVRKPSWWTHLLR